MCSSCEPLNRAVEFVQTCASGVSEAFTECGRGIEEARERLVVASYERCPRALAILIEKVSMAVPKPLLL